jgi:hypothetical protein
MRARIEIYGSEGRSMPAEHVRWSGEVRKLAPTPGQVPLTHSVDVGRGVGAADMAYALQSDRQHRASGDLAFHVLDLMHAVVEASASGCHIMLNSGVPRPAPLPVGLPPGQLDP